MNIYTGVAFCFLPVVLLFAGCFPAGLTSKMVLVNFAKNLLVLFFCLGESCAVVDPRCCRLMQCKYFLGVCLICCVFSIVVLLVLNKINNSFCLVARLHFASCFHMYYVNFCLISCLFF